MTTEKHPDPIRVLFHFSFDKTGGNGTGIVKGITAWKENLCRESFTGSGWAMQELFNELIHEQLETMDKLLFLQSEIERCQDLEKELIELEELALAESLKREIEMKKSELKDIQKVFQEQTDEVIRSYKKEQEVSL